MFEERLADVWICRMENYRDYTKFEKCSKCQLLAWCRGCPAVAGGRNGDFYAVMQFLLGYPREGDAHPKPKPRREGRVLRF